VEGRAQHVKKCASLMWFDLWQFTVERVLFSWERTHAAEALGLSRQGLLKKMERYGFS